MNTSWSALEQQESTEISSSICLSRSSLGRCSHGTRRRYSWPFVEPSEANHRVRYPSSRDMESGNHLEYPSSLSGLCSASRTARSHVQHQRQRKCTTFFGLSSLYGIESSQSLSRTHLSGPLHTSESRRNPKAGLPVRGLRRRNSPKHSRESMRTT